MILESHVDESQICPHFGAGPEARWGFASSPHWRRCRACKCKCNALTVTASSWRLCGTRNFGWPMRNRWLRDKARVGVSRIVVSTGTQRSASGIAFDVCPRNRNRRNRKVSWKPVKFFLRSFKGMKVRLPQAYLKRGGKTKKPGLSKEQVLALICRLRGGHTGDAVLKKIRSKEVGNVLLPMLAKDSVLCADGSSVYVREARELEVPLKAVNVKAGIRAVERVFHVQNVNAYDSCLKIWVHGIQRKVTVDHHYYFGWRRLLDHFRESMDPKVLLRTALGIAYLQNRTVI